MPVNNEWDRMWKKTDISLLWWTATSVLGGNEWWRPKETPSPVYCVASEVRNRCLLNIHQPSECISKNENAERCETWKTKSIWYGEGTCSNWKLEAKGPMLTDLHDAVFSLSSYIAPHTPIPLLAFSESRFQFYRRVFSVNWLARWQ